LRVPKVFLQSKKTNFKNVKDGNRHFSKENIKMTTKVCEKMLNILAIMVNANKTHIEIILYLH
jgi:hypothetical protein